MLLETRISEIKPEPGETSVPGYPEQGWRDALDLEIKSLRSNIHQENLNPFLLIEHLILKKPSFEYLSLKFCKRLNLLNCNSEIREFRIWKRLSPPLRKESRKI